MPRRIRYNNSINCMVGVCPCLASCASIGGFMEKLTMAVPCLFGLEGLVGDELRRMKLENVRVEDRRVFFDGDFADMARANVRLRMGERVMLLLARFPARSFEELYQGVKAIPLERFVPKEGAFPVKGYSLDSQLHSVPDCQSCIKLHA